MKTKILSLLICLGLAGETLASTDIKALSEELEIMKGILKTTLKKPVNTSHINVHDVDATYLVGQGVVFEMQTSNMDWSFEYHFISDSGVHVVEPPAPPQPPVTIITGAGTNSWNLDFDAEGWQDMAEDAMREARNALRQVKGKLRNLNEEQHEIAWEMRDLERKKRELSFAKRTADGERAKDLDENLQEVEQELARLVQRKQEVSKYAEEIRAEQERKEVEKRQAKEKAYKRFLAKFESEVGDVLCRYGAGLRELPRSEHISFVLPKFDSNSSGKSRQDRIYVFSAEDVSACVRDKIDKEKLLTNAKSYLF